MLSPILHPPCRLPIAAEPRALALEGTRNSRELGGLPAGRGVIRKQLIFRSDALADLTPRDVDRLAAIPVRTVVDFRVAPEITPDQVDRFAAANRVALPMWANLDGDNWPKMYHDLVSQNPRAIEGFFATAACPENYPLLFHCHSGKDRTGILAALLLELVGTPREAIMADYLQSQHDAPTPIVDRTWLQEVFDMVDAEGGIEPFLAARQVTHEQMASVRTILLEGTAPAEAPTALPQLHRYRNLKLDTTTLRMVTQPAPPGPTFQALG